MRKIACFGWILFLGLAMARPGLAEEFQISVGADDCGSPPGPSNCLGGSYNDTGTTINANGTVAQVNAGCFQHTAVPGVDVIYTFLSSNAFSNPNFVISVTPSPTYDVAIYLVGPGVASCPAGPNAIVGNCVTGADAGGPGITETIPHAALVGLSLFDTYYLFIDSSVSGPASAGTYSLSFGPSTCPVALTDYSIE